MSFASKLDPTVESPVLLAPLIDPNLHSCGTVRPHGARELAQPEPGFYFAGMKSYGRAPTFLMLTGYEQVRSIAAELAGDVESAPTRRTDTCLRRVFAAARAAVQESRLLRRPPQRSMPPPAAPPTRAARKAGAQWLRVFMNDVAQDAPGRPRSIGVIVALGTTQTVAWASSYYLPADPGGSHRARPRHDAHRHFRGRCPARLSSRGCLVRALGISSIRLAGAVSGRLQFGLRSPACCCCQSHARPAAARRFVAAARHRHGHGALRSGLRHVDAHLWQPRRDRRLPASR